MSSTPSTEAEPPQDTDPLGWWTVALYLVLLVPIAGIIAVLVGQLTGSGLWAMVGGLVGFVLLWIWVEEDRNAAGSTATHAE